MQQHGISRRLFATFAVLASTFVASNAYINWLSVEIDTQSETLVTNALPSIARLAAASGLLRQLETAIDEAAALSPEDRAVAGSHVMDLAQRVHAELAGYRDLPSYPGEEALFQDEPIALERLEQAASRLLRDGAPSGPDPTATYRQIHSLVGEAMAVLHQLIRLNSTQAFDGAASIRTTRHSVGTAAGALNAVTMLLTAGMALWLWRVVRSFSRLQADHARLVERRAQELEMFGSRVAHDLLSPLSSLTFCLASFKPAAEGDPKLEDALRRARQCIVRTRGLVDGLFDFACAGGEPRPGEQSDVAEVVSQVVEELEAAGPSGRMKIVVGPMPRGSVRCTAGVLTSILGNMLRNAIQHTGDAADSRVAIRGFRIGDCMRIEVEDSGPGVPEGFEEAIFEPYVRGPGSSTTGLGLGLATVRRLCQAHGGDVGYRPRGEPGSVFWFSIPMATPYAAAHGASGRRSMHGLSTAR